MTIEAKRSRFRRSGPSGRVQCFRLASGAQAVMLFRSRQALTHAYQTKGSESLGSTAPVKQTVSYLRVSSKDQQREGYSIPAQRKLLQEYAQRHGFELAREFVDIETAKSAGRKQFGEMVRFLQQSPESRTILVEKTDRL